MDADGGAGEAVGVAELPGQVRRLDEHVVGCRRVAGLVERGTQGQQHLDPGLRIGSVGQLQGGECPAQLCGGIREGQLARCLDGGVLGVLDGRHHGLMEPACRGVDVVRRHHGVGNRCAVGLELGEGAGEREVQLCLDDRVEHGAEHLAEQVVDERERRQIVVG